MVIYLLLGVFSDHLDVATQRKGAQRVFCLPFLSHPQLGPETDGKSHHSDPGQFRDEKMTRFMNPDEETEPDERGANCVDYVFHSLSPSVAVNKSRSLLPRPAIYLHYFINFFGASARMSLHRIGGDAMNLTKSDPMFQKCR